MAPASKNYCVFRVYVWERERDVEVFERVVKAPKEEREFIECEIAEEASPVRSFQFFFNKENEKGKKEKGFIIFLKLGPWALQMGFILGPYIQTGYFETQIKLCPIWHE